MIRWWTVACVVIWSGWAAGAAGQADSVLVAGNGAGCRAAPDVSGELIRRLAVGQFAAVSDTGEEWTLIDLDGVVCWVWNPLLVPHEAGRRDDSLVRAATSMLNRRPRPSASDFAVLGRLVEQRLGSLGADAPPLLQLQLLLLLDGAGRAPFGNAREWLATHESVLEYYEPARAYFVRRTAYQALYEAHSSDPAADVLAWEYLSRPPMGECETDVNCRLDQVLESVADYWRQFPQGSHVAQAISEATSTLSFALEYACEPGGGEMGDADPARLDAIEASLLGVTPAERAPVLEQLSLYRDKCGGL